MDYDSDADGVADAGSQPTLPLRDGGAPAAPGVLVGGRYRIVRWLGSGGMGSVYEVDDCELGVRVALKMAEGAAWDAATVAQLKREIQLARRVTHPNVCRVHDFGLHVLPQGGSTPFLTMELIAGHTLAAELAACGRFDVDRALALAEPMAAALDAAHAAGVVHRDFKTGNVMLSGDRTVVTDFGLAIDSEERGAAGVLVGSPAYMAPEQVEGGPVTVATDVYAFGVVLYELLTGRVPFGGSTAIAVALRRLSTPPPPLRDALPDLPARWEQVILRCLSVAPHERFDTCADVVRELRAARAPMVSAVRGGERRSMALVLARDVVDAAFDEAVEAHAGTIVFAASGSSQGAAPPRRPSLRSALAIVELAPDYRAAVFGAEHSLGDELERALAAAQAISLSAERVALAMGHASLKDGTLAGDAVREAQSAIDRAVGGVVCTARTAALLGARCEVVETEPGLFAIEALRPIASSSLVGREAELTALRRARDAVLSESRVLGTWVVGPPGCGKSRLLDAAIALALEAGMTVSSARASAHDPRAYGLFARPSDAATEESRAARVLAADDPDVGRLSQSFGRGHDAEAIANRARARALARIVELAREGPSALVLDDLQWADPASLGLLAELPGVLGDVPLWVVLAARDEVAERRPELFDAFELAARVEPSSLRAADVAELARARIGVAPTPPIAQAIADRAGGNPLYVEQLLDVLDRPALEGHAIEEWPLPATIELAVQARLDQLPEDERRCVGVLAVLGRPASAIDVAAIAGGEVRDALGALGRRGLVARAPSEGGAYRLRSALVGEVASRMIDEERLRELHRKAAEMARGRDSEEVARHLAALRDERGAASAYVRATLEHAVRGDSPGVLRCAARAIELGVDRAHAFAVCFARAEAAWFAGDPALQRAMLDDAWRAAGDDRERALVASEQGEWLRRNRKPDDALSHLSRAVELAASSGDDDTRVRATARLASALTALGRHDEARAALDATDGKALDPSTRAIVEDARGWLAGHVGDYGAVRAAYARAAELYAQAGDLRRAAGAESNLADATNRLGRYADAERALRRALELARKVGNRLTEGYALMNLGFALAEQGRVEAASSSLADAVRIARAVGDTRLELGARLYATRTRLDATGVLVELDAIAAEAAGDPMLEANAYALAARAWLAQGDARRASEAAERAIAIRDARGAIEEGEGDVFLAAALALEASGQRERAAEVRARGAERVLELAARIADLDARRSFLESVPAHRALTQPSGAAGA